MNFLTKCAGIFCADYMGSDTNVRRWIRGSYRSRRRLIHVYSAGDGLFMSINVQSTPYCRLLVSISVLEGGVVGLGASSCEEGVGVWGG